MIRPLMAVLLLALSGCFTAMNDGADCGGCPTGQVCEQLPDCHPAETGPCLFACRPAATTVAEPDAGSPADAGSDPCGGSCLSHQHCEQMPDCFPGMGPCLYVCLPASAPPTPSAH